MAKDDGGQAFPVVEPEVEGQNRAYVLSYGMTLRDYFASRVLDMASHDLAEPEEVARRAYAIADAMLSERNR